MRGDVLIVGGGLAAQRCCETLRREGSRARSALSPTRDGRLTIAHHCRRTSWPASAAPTVSPFARMLVRRSRCRPSPGGPGGRPRSQYQDRDVESGAILDYDKAVVATGSRPRRLPGTESFANTHLLRTAEDAARLHALWPEARLVVVGAGFIGLEVAATARRLGCHVTVLEAAPSALGRVLVPELADWFVDLHRAEGVHVLFSAHVARFGEARGDVEWVQLTDGSRFYCDALVLGIGIEPATEWLEGSGLETDGVRVDVCGRTSAAGRLRRGRRRPGLQSRERRIERSEHWEAAAARARRSRAPSSGSIRCHRRCPPSGPTSSAIAFSWSETPVVATR